jgi:hypothetical protein
MIAVLALALALQAREEVVAVPKTDVKVAVVHVPVEGTALRSYALGKHETTWEQFLVFYRGESTEKRVIDGITRPSIGMVYFGQVQTPEALLKPGVPAINLRWHAAMAYCDWLTATTGRKFRLPTESEWEHAAKAGGGDAWHAGNSGERTHAPSESKPNALGIHDLLGNVWEACLEPLDGAGCAPVYRGGAWNSPKDRVAPGLRSRVPAEWFSADPNRPRSVWWLTSDFSQGCRPALVGDEAAVKASADYAPKLVLTLKGAVEKQIPLSKEDREKVESPGSDFFMTVSGEVVNGGDRAVEELELLVYLLDAKGGPHFLEKEGANKPNRPNYTWTYPVLANSAHEAPRRPLVPGGTRAFSVDVPYSWDAPQYIQQGKFGARVTWVRFAPR